MPHERRLSVRKMPEYLAYLSLPSNNGGVVMDISEGGLGFRAIAPVQVDGPIHFRFAIDSAARIRAIGELAWTDEARKIGGLRFTQLPDEVREQIRAWAVQSNTGAKASAEASAKYHASVFDIPNFQPAVEAQAPAAAASKVEFAHVTKTGHPLLYNLKPSIYKAPPHKLSMYPVELRSATDATAVGAPQPVAMKHPIGAVGLTIVLAFVVSIGIFTYLSTSPAGDFLFDWGEKMWNHFYSQTMPGDPAPPASSAPASSNIHRQ